MSVYLQDAFDAGARLLVDADIHEVEIEAGDQDNRVPRSKRLFVADASAFPTVGGQPDVDRLWDRAARRR